MKQLLIYFILVFMSVSAVFADEIEIERGTTKFTVMPGESYYIEDGKLFRLSKEEADELSKGFENSEWEEYLEERQVRKVNKWLECGLYAVMTYWGMSCPNEYGAFPKMAGMVFMGKFCIKFNTPID